MTHEQYLYISEVTQQVAILDEQVIISDQEQDNNIIKYFQELASNIEINESYS